MSYVKLLTRLGYQGNLPATYCNEVLFTYRLKKLLNENIKPRINRTWTPDVRIDLLSKIFGLGGVKQEYMKDIAVEEGLHHSRISQIVDDTVKQIQSVFDPSEYPSASTIHLGLHALLTENQTYRKSFNELR